MRAPERVSVIGSGISVCGSVGALDYIADSLQRACGGYVCFTNAHGAVMGRKEARFRGITNGSLLSLADGMSVYCAGRWKGAASLGHVPGPDFLLQSLQQFPERRHFFYGSRPEVLTALLTALRSRIPNLNICGSRSPPFRTQSRVELLQDIEDIKSSGAEFVWVGLGAPKQEVWMAEAWESLRPAILFGVGAAFDFYAGSARRAPESWRRAGLEWFFRLLQEPKRLWRRYLTTNTLFLIYLLQDAVAGSRREQPQ
jgi:N-acetylglucosaminyldiphosphoundecaprenol N-acetyl-beta-D-mannosaminyltransferase